MTALFNLPSTPTASSASSAPTAPSCLRPSAARANPARRRAAAPLAALALAASLIAAAPPAQAVGRLADITVVDRDSGAVLPVYEHRGEFWVAGRPGARYAVQVRNPGTARVLAVTSVDGVNVVSGETAGWSQTGYVFSARQRYQITGWRKSDSEVAAFEFSDARDGYAARTGRPGQVGVIGVALFRERAPAPPVSVAPARSRQDASAMAERQADARDEAMAPPPASPLSARPAAPVAAAPGRSDSATSDRESTGAAQAPQASPVPEAKAAPAKLGTAHGARETSVVQNTDFERASERPDEIVRIRYDSRDNLLALGVIPPPARPPLTGAVPDPFPQSPLTAYVPDPPRRPAH